MSSEVGFKNMEANLPEVVELSPPFALWDALKVYIIKESKSLKHSKKKTETHGVVVEGIEDSSGCGVEGTNKHHVDGDVVDDDDRARGGGVLSGSHG